MAKKSRIYRRTPKKRKEKRLVDKERLKLYRRTEEQINQVNKRMKKLVNSGYEGTWSSRKFLNRVIGDKFKSKVEVVRSRGKISGVRLKGGLSKTQLYGVHKASRQFLESKTSTLEGIESVRKETLKSLRLSLSDIDSKLSKKDTEFLYNMLEMNEMRDLADDFGASNIWALAQDTIEYKDNKEEFLDRFERDIATLNDTDMKEKAEKIYEYLKPKIKRKYVRRK